MNNVLLKKILINISYSLLLFITIMFLSFFMFRISSGSNSFSQFDSGFLFADFLSWFKNLIITLDFGNTLSGKPVLDKILFPTLNTILLTISSLIIGFTVSLTIGWYWSLNNKNIIVDTFVRFINVLSSIPLFLASFIIALSIHYVIIDIYSDHVTVVQLILYYLTPILALTFFDGFLSEMINFIKIRIDEISSQQFITSLEIRGGNKKKHMLKHIFHDLLSIVNTKFLNLIGGAIVVEIIFGWQGIGLQCFNAVINRDYSLFMGIIIITTVIILLFNSLIITINFIVNKRYQLNINN